MQLRRVAAFILGGWIIGSLFMLYIESQTSEGSEIVLANPPQEIRKMIKTLGQDDVTKLLEYRDFVERRQLNKAWGIAQLVIAGALVLVLVQATRRSKLALALWAAMLVLAVFAYFILSPEISFLGRDLTFRTEWSGNRARYLALRAAFWACELVKAGLGFALAISLFIYRPSRRRSSEDLEEAESGG